MTTRNALGLAAILAVAAGLRASDLGRASLWYDEVVTMTLARADGPTALIESLGRIDATRAPLHPLLLQQWLRVFGASDAAGRSFSVVCGVLTVALIYRLGLRAYGDVPTALWAAALAAVSPMLVVYSREARMYAWLVLVTCLAWDALLNLRDGPTSRRLAWYAAWLAALGYSHPLGLLMIAALCAASLVVRPAAGRSRGRWLAPYAAAGLALAPWIPRYLDHDPESTVGRLPIQFLLGTPIGFLGGNFLALALFAGVIAFGLSRSRDRRTACACLVLWLAVPPVLLYAYSRLSHPIFGPARYTLFVAPAYLLLLARGLTRMPLLPRIGVASLAFGLAASALPGTVYGPDLKADWRAVSSFLNAADPSERDAVVVLTADPAHNVETVTARYYLGPMRPVTDAPPRSGRAWYAIGVRSGRPVADLPLVAHRGMVRDFPGLRLVGPVGDAD